MFVFFFPPPPCLEELFPSYALGHQAASWKKGAATSLRKGTLSILKNKSQVFCNNVGDILIKYSS